MYLWIQNLRGRGESQHFVYYCHFENHFIGFYNFISRNPFSTFRTSSPNNVWIIATLYSERTGSKVIVSYLHTLSHLVPCGWWAVVIPFYSWENWATERQQLCLFSTVLPLNEIIYVKHTHTRSTESKCKRQVDLRMNNQRLSRIWTLFPHTSFNSVRLVWNTLSLVISILQKEGLGFRGTHTCLRLRYQRETGL